MKIKYIEGDLFDHISTDKPMVIAHIVNDKGAWGKGFVLPLAAKFPKARTHYVDWASGLSGSNFMRGKTQFVQVDEFDESDLPLITVANMVAQTLGGSRPLHYNDLATCMDEVALYMGMRLRSEGEIICPMFGSGLAGGDWNFVEKLIEDCWLRRSIPVTVCYFKQFLPDNWSPPQEDHDDNN